MKAQIVTIGDEILIGQIIDTNSAWMAEQLNLQGISILEMTSIGDTREEILRGLQYALSRADLVLVTGGLGPTKDDITKKTIAEFFGAEMVLHQPTYDRIKRFFEKLNRAIPHEAILQQCLVPNNCTVLTNKMGTAPGMWFAHEGKIIISMPGVPSEMKNIMEHEALPRLKKELAGLPIAHRTILTAGEGETNLAKMIEDIEDNLPPNLKIAYLPSIGQVRLRLTGRHENEATLNEMLNEYAAKLEERVSKYVYGHEKETIEAVIGQILLSQGKKITFAESCTGGYVQHRLTAVAGASAYFAGGVVAYSYELKTKMLKVKASTLKKHGAVSEETVIEMAQGALKLTGADVAVSVSGIAGPTGGTPEKPVGTIWMAVADKNRVKTMLLRTGRDRMTNIHYAGNQVLNMTRKFLLGEW
jgi:nicotinamide-nucleotide amidase